MRSPLDFLLFIIIKSVHQKTLNKKKSVICYSIISRTRNGRWFQKGVRALTGYTNVLTNFIWDNIREKGEQGGYLKIQNHFLKTCKNLQFNLHSKFFPWALPKVLWYITHKGCLHYVSMMRILHYLAMFVVMHVCTVDTCYQWLMDNMLEQCSPTWANELISLFHASFPQINGCNA